jgi:hypothetical protein
MNAEHTRLVLNEVFVERERQFEKWGEQNLPIIRDHFSTQMVEGYKNLCDKTYKEGNLTFNHILTEEYLEAFAEKDFSKEQREELIQVAAVAVQIIEYIDRVNKK